MIIVTIRGKWKTSGIKKTNVILTNQGYWTLSLTSGPGVNRVLSAYCVALCIMCTHIIKRFGKSYLQRMTTKD